MIDDEAAGALPGSSRSPKFTSNGVASSGTISPSTLGPSCMGVRSLASSSHSSGRIEGKRPQAAA